MQAACAFHLFEFAPKLSDPVADQTAVGLDLGFAWPTKEAEAAALAFQMGPAAHKTASLIIKMCEFDLQAAFGGRCTFSENLEDKPGAIYHFALQLVFEIALLDGGQYAIDDDQFSLTHGACRSNVQNLPFAKQCCSARFADGNYKCVSHNNADGERKAPRLLQPAFCVATAARTELRTHDYSARTPRNLAFGFFPVSQA